MRISKKELAVLSLPIIGEFKPTPADREMPRTIKSARELADMIIVELRKHPQCKDVLKIRITRPVTKNWDVTVIWSRERECPAPCTKIVEATVQCLRALYDLPGRM